MAVSTQHRCVPEHCKWNFDSPSCPGRASTCITVSFYTDQDALQQLWTTRVVWLNLLKLEKYYASFVAAQWYSLKTHNLKHTRKLKHGLSIALSLSSPDLCARDVRLQTLRPKSEIFVGSPPSFRSIKILSCLIQFGLFRKFPKGILNEPYK